MKCDVLIVGAGMVGLSIAHQLKERKIINNVMILEKERVIGIHSSGRNSGVLHAGVYYKPNTLKAKVCVEGAKRLKNWIEEKNLEINKCGKAIIPQKEDLDGQLEELRRRASLNGAEVSIIDNDQLKKISRFAESCTGRALWSPNTVVVKPIEIIQKLENELTDMGVLFVKYAQNWKKGENNELILEDGKKIQYGYLINCSGQNSDTVAHRFGVGLEYKMMPFKGSYWKLKKDCPIDISCNIYPVPDLELPFLGVHLTPSVLSDNYVSIGPTATLALGRENYTGVKGINIKESLHNIGLLAERYLKNEGNMREYANQQAFLVHKKQITKQVKALVPEIKTDHIERSKKVGIRAQLFNIHEKKLEDDFVCVKGKNSLHVLNAISPAFTASFALADEIINRAEL